MDVNSRLKPVRRASKQPGLEIVYRPLDELKPDPANARLHSKKQIRQIAESIRVFGFNVPILVDRDLKVICGHGRLLAGRELGLTEVPTLCLDHLTAAQARAFMIADNRLTEIASWDDRLLVLEIVRDPRRAETVVAELGGDAGPRSRADRSSHRRPLAGGLCA